MRMQQRVGAHECERKRVADTPMPRNKFGQFVNVDGNKHGNLDGSVRKTRRICHADCTGHADLRQR